MPELSTVNFVPPSFKRKIVDTFFESNKKLCEEFLGIEYLNWMNPKIEENDKGFYDRFGYPGAQIYELCQAVIKLIDKVTNKE